MARAGIALDQTRWLGLWSRLGAKGSGLPQFERLQSAYTEPARSYHNATHIENCLAELDRSRQLAQHPDEVEAALWYHDVVYVPGARDNEERSAQQAEADLEVGELPSDLRRRVSGLVLATRHHQMPEEPDAQLICDIDLAILGQDPRTYDEFERRIRREYIGVPELAYQIGRSALLNAFLTRPSIYSTDLFRSQYEEQARANLVRTLTQLVQPGPT